MRCKEHNMVTGNAGFFRKGFPDLLIAGLVRRQKVKTEQQHSGAVLVGNSGAGGINRIHHRIGDSLRHITEACKADRIIRCDVCLAVAYAEYTVDIGICGGLLIGRPGGSRGCCCSRFGGSFLSAAGGKHTQRQYPYQEYRSDFFHN